MYCRLASVANAAASNPCGSVLRVMPTARRFGCRRRSGLSGEFRRGGNAPARCGRADGVNADGALLLALAVAPEYCRGAPRRLSAAQEHPQHENAGEDD